MKRYWLVPVTLVLALSSACALGARVSGAPKPSNGGVATPRPANVLGTHYMDSAGFPLAASSQPVGLVAAYNRDQVERIAPPGRHYVTVAFTVTNLSRDRPAPLLIGVPSAAPTLYLEVPRRFVRALGLGCKSSPGLERLYSPEAWCPIRMGLHLSPVGASPLSSSTLPAGASVMDFYYSTESFPDAALKAADVGTWGLAFQSAPDVFVKIKSR